ncbi:hypothetical protein F511_38275 [Dorcoceras hygrometricum]|uniref:Uncharacterized protein n=1 Tax=Dorcoceras hygrometricum TaxID=472368 RepID=A0A2Z7A7B7_9LAMI|nr:hypothetical protein F511_38275 [Dorcoceras hygrometricum]
MQIKQCRPLIRQAGTSRNMATSAAAAGGASGNNGAFWRMAKSGDFAPVWMVAGMVCIAGSIGIHTATQQLRRSPSVQVTKKMRESVPEVEIPDAVLGSAEKFIDRSFLRKVAHIQDDYKDQPDSPTQSIFTRQENVLVTDNVTRIFSAFDTLDKKRRSRDIESLKSVGVHP